MIIIKTKTYVVLKIANAMSSKNLKTEPLMDAVECVCIKVRRGVQLKISLVNYLLVQKSKKDVRLSNSMI